jgi:hypothetical protein
MKLKNSKMRIRTGAWGLVWEERDKPINTCFYYLTDKLSISIKDFVREKKIRNRKKERAARAIF